MFRRLLALAATVAVVAIVGASPAAARPRVQSVAGVLCVTEMIPGAACFDVEGDVGTQRAIVVNATDADLAQCRLGIVANRAGRPAACVGAGGVLVLAGRVVPHVSQARLDAVGSEGVCIGGRPMGPKKVDPAVACFVRGDLLLAGDAHTLVPR